jgi:hypothetical protein
VPSQAGEQCGAATLVQTAHAAKMSGEVTLPEKLREHCLVQRGGEQIERFSRVEEPLPE